MLQKGNRLRIILMMLSLGAPAIIAADIKHLVIRIFIPVSGLVAAQTLLGHCINANAANPRGSCGKILFNKSITQTDRLKNLRAAIRLYG